MRMTTRRWLVAGIALCAALILTGLFHGSLRARGGAELYVPGHGEQQTSEPFACEGVGGIPEDQCRALAALYQSTNGSGWLTDTNWLQIGDGLTPCDWYGVSCAGGQVSELRLSANRLAGELPAALLDLAGLTVLLLDNNQLTGNLPRRVCRLTNSVVTADLGYNLLSARTSAARQCLDTLDPDWLQTQTVPPRDLAVTAITSDSIELAWTPIPYGADGGYYEFGIATAGAGGPYTLHGQTADKQASTYTLDGLQPGRTYFVRMRTVTPAHDDQPDELVSEAARSVAVTLAPGRAILLAVFFPADNNLMPFLGDVVERLRQGSSFNPNVQIALLADGRGEGNTRLLHIAQGTVEETDAVFDRWGTDELDTADPAVLAWFLQHARDTYPAEWMVVSLMGHGVGPAPHIELAEQSARTRLPPLPQGHPFTPDDVTDNSYLSTVELGDALLEATDNGADPFEILFFDQCFQGNYDVLYQVRNTAKYIVASPNYAWLAAPYGRYVTRLAPALTGRAVVDLVIQIYESTLDNRHPNAVFWLRGDDLDNIAGAVDGLADALLAATRAGEASPILAAAEASQFVDTTQCRDQRLTLGPPDELLGAGSFATQLQNQFAAGDPHGVHAAAAALLTALDDVRGLARTGNPWIAPDETWTYTDTLTLVAPLSRDLPAETLWRSSIYTETANLRSSWSLSPTSSLTIARPFASTVDGRWDNFIAEWYGDLTPTVGEWCNYIPPTLTLSEDADSFALTVEPDSGSEIVHLSWEATTDDRADAYWLFSRRPEDLEWNLHETVSLDSTQYTSDTLPPGIYHFMVGVHSADDLFVAQSNEVTWTAGAAQIYLPELMR